jgi:hypothetical protein
MHRSFMDGNLFLSCRCFWVLGWRRGKFQTSFWSKNLRLRNFLFRLKPLNSVDLFVSTRFAIADLSEIWFNFWNFYHCLCYLCFQLAFSNKISTVVGGNVFTSGMNWAVAFDLPNHTLRSPRKNRASPLLLRSQRRELYRRLETAMNSWVASIQV